MLYFGRESLNLRVEGREVRLEQFPEAFKHLQDRSQIGTAVAGMDPLRLHYDQPSLRLIVEERIDSLIVKTVGGMLRRDVGSHARHDAEGVSREATAQKHIILLLGREYRAVAHIDMRRNVLSE